MASLPTVIKDFIRGSIPTAEQVVQ